MKVAEKLLPCPFCGRAATLVKSKSKVNDYRIKCKSCGITTGWWYGKSDVIEVWNTRVYPPEVQAAIERDKPKEPIIRASRCQQNYYCPNCDNDVSETYDCCSACGQRFNWRE